MFRLEALKARHGDCLLLHWGDGATAGLALIDGGPDRTYHDSLRPRLAELAGTSRTLAINLLMLSHIDDDHINGLLALGEDILAGKSPAEVRMMWFNSLEGLLDGIPAGRTADVATTSVRHVFGSGGRDWTEWDEKVLASVPQGQNLDALAKRLPLHKPLNWPYDRLVVRGAKPEFADIEGLRLTPVAPSRSAIEALRKVWKEKRREGATAAYNDRSPYNLSSIVVVAEHGGGTMLLTGDALGRDVIDGLADLCRLDSDGRAHFDLLKLPHHGSQNNVDEEFFRTLTADHYVVSGDHVKFPNPHVDAMGWLAKARAGDDYLIWCTYELDYMREIFGEKLRTPPPSALGVSVDVE